uniref:Uncharacterized protein n=1 Tax=Branchiostoma floridae TaxID=7739 RepID=C3ZIX4_BRAFL|eukprot:XP_002591479.1 hypothetical protein BRAFLDRAFT_105251 [Branchiostoma floridae]
MEKAGSEQMWGGTKRAADNRGNIRHGEGKAPSRCRAARNARQITGVTFVMERAGSEQMWGGTKRAADNRGNIRHGELGKAPSRCGAARNARQITGVTFVMEEAGSEQMWGGTKRAADNRGNIRHGESRLRADSARCGGHTGDSGSREITGRSRGSSDQHRRDYCGSRPYLGLAGGAERGQDRTCLCRVPWCLRSVPGALAGGLRAPYPHPDSRPPYPRVNVPCALPVVFCGETCQCPIPRCLRSVPGALAGGLTGPTAAAGAGRYGTVRWLCRHGRCTARPREARIHHSSPRPSVPVVARTEPPGMQAVKHTDYVGLRAVNTGRRRQEIAG